MLIGLDFDSTSVLAANYLLPGARCAEELQGTQKNVSNNTRPGPQPEGDNRAFAPPEIFTNVCIC